MQGLFGVSLSWSLSYEQEQTVGIGQEMRGKKRNVIYNSLIRVVGGDNAV
jgi:hypothetical protein